MLPALDELAAGVRAAPPWKKQAIVVAFVLVVAAVVMAPVAVIASSHRVTVGELTRDPTGLAHLPWWSGIISKLGIAFWCAASAVCWFARSCARARKRADSAAFFFRAALVSSLFGADDHFLLHEAFGAQTGRPDHEFFLIHAMLLGYYLWRDRLRILPREHLVLVLALASLAVSLAFDAGVVRLSTHGRSLLVEDGAKLMGILAWTAFHWRAAMREMLD